MSKLRVQGFPGLVYSPAGWVDTAGSAMPALRSADRHERTEGGRMMAIVNKPTIGLKPRHIHCFMRYQEIKGAIDRHTESTPLDPIPEVWISELWDVLYEYNSALEDASEKMTRSAVRPMPEPTEAGE